MAAIIGVSDLPAALRSAELIDAMVDGANAKASRVAPCLIWDGSDDDQPVPSDDQLAEARLVLIGAIRRWAEAGSGAYSQQVAGPFSVATDTRQRTGFNLWPSEIADLQAICSTGSRSGAFSITPTGASGHAPWCDLMFGGLDCSCGYTLSAGAGWIYEPAVEDL